MKFLENGTRPQPPTSRPFPQKRPTYIRRDLYTSKETSMHRWTPSNETYRHQKRPSAWKRQISTTGWQRPIGCLSFVGHFPQKSHQIRGSFAERDVRLMASYASSPPCNFDTYFASSQLVSFEGLF